MLLGLVFKSPKKLVLKIVVTILPVYAIAFFTDSMIYVLPMIAVCLFLGTSFDKVKISETKSR
jgi:hypothetical protein